MIALVATADGVVRVADDEAARALPGFDVRALAADGASGLLFAGGRGGVRRSRDGGRTWEEAGLAGADVRALAAARDLLVAGTKPARLHASRDGGATWTELAGFRRAPGRWRWWSPAEPPGTAYVSALALGDGSLHAGIEVGGVVSSFDGGATWSRAKGAILDCHTLCGHARDPSRLYQGGAGLRASTAVSDDGGRSFRKLPGWPGRSYGWAAAGDADDPALVLGSASSSPFAAHGGRDANAVVARWRGEERPVAAGGALAPPLRRFPYAIVADPRLGGRFVALLDDGSLAETLDAGATWREHAANAGPTRGPLLLLG